MATEREETETKWEREGGRDQEVGIKSCKLHTHVIQEQKRLYFK